VSLTGLRTTRATEAPRPYSPPAAETTAEPDQTTNDTGEQTAESSGPAPGGTPEQAAETGTGEPEGPEGQPQAEGKPLILRAQRTPRTPYKAKSRAVRAKAAQIAKKAAMGTAKTIGATSVLAKRLAVNAALAPGKVEVNVERPKGFIKGRLKRIITVRHADGRVTRKEVSVVTAPVHAAAQSVRARINAVTDAMTK
jgi:hypothetical protein